MGGADGLWSHASLLELRHRHLHEEKKKGSGNSFCPLGKAWETQVSLSE